VSEAAAALHGLQLRGDEARINLDDVLTHDAAVSQLPSVSESPASRPLRANLPLALAPSQSLRSTPLLGPDFAHTQPVRRRGSWMIWVGGLVLLMLSAAAACLVQMGQMPLPEFLAQQLSERGIELDLSSPQPPPPQPPRGAWAQQSEPGIPRLLVQGSRGIVGEPVLLGVTLEGQAEGAVVMITGLVPGMKLSIGAAVGADTWQVPASDLAHTWIGPPNDFAGVVDLMVELHLADTTIVDRRPIHFEWAAATPVIASAGPTIASEPPAVAPELPVVASEPPAVAPQPPRGAVAQQSEPGIPRLLVQGSRGIIGEPVLLGVTLEGQAEGAVVMITGLVSGMKLSTGAAVGANTWQVPATDLAHTWISPPNDFVGVVDLMFELHLADTTTVDSRPIHFEWAAATPVIASAGPTIVPEPPAVAPELPVVASEPPTVAPLPREAAPGPLQLDADEIAILVTRGKEFIANGDLAGARLALQRAAESKDTQAALILAASYDPVILRELKVYGLAADIAMARMWYEKAKEFGSAEAPRRLEILASGAR
jgi:hypothetical protein